MLRMLIFAERALDGKLNASKEALQVLKNLSEWAHV